MEDFKQALELANFGPQLIEEYQDIRGELPLLKDIWIKSNTHLGQRKLLLNEMNFYNRLPKTPCLIIYSGSAPGEHTPFILKHYPHIRFIFVDPNFHFMKERHFEYIYKAKGTGNLEKLKSITQIKNKRSADVKKMYEMNKRVKCGDKIINAFEVDEFGSIDNLLGINNKLTDNGTFEGSRVFIIQDYITPELVEEIKKRVYVDYYISDIRSENDDIGVLFDNALQFLVCRTLNCISHLKFVLPKYQEAREVPEWMTKTFNQCIEQGMDFLGEYFRQGDNPVYTYLKGEIFVQPWARGMSGETRLLLQPNAEMVPYDAYEWRRKFNYYNFYRAVPYGKAIKNMYCGCQDCLLEQKIIKDLIVLKSRPCTIQSIKREIDFVTFYSLEKHCETRPKRFLEYETYSEKGLYLIKKNLDSK